MVVAAVTEALISAGAGLVVGLVPFAYLVRKDRQAERERKSAEEQRKRAEEQIELERQRQLRANVAKAHLALVGQVMALLDALRVDADNADDLLKHVSEAHAELQGVAQGDLLLTFGASSPAVWADRACRRILRKALGLALEARAQGQTGQAARDTSLAIQNLTEAGDYGGPRDLLRWATEEAIDRWPQEPTSFEGRWQDTARHVAYLADLELPSTLVPEGSSPP